MDTAHYLGTYKLCIRGRAKDAATPSQILVAIPATIEYFHRRYCHILNSSLECMRNTKTILPRDMNVTVTVNL